VRLTPIGGVLKKIAILGAVVVLVALGGCATTGSRPTTPSSPPSSTKLTPVGGIVDPIAEITDRSDARYVASDVSPILDKRSQGPKTFSIDITAGTKSVRVYIACVPTSHFKVTIGKWFSGGCASTFQNWADLPQSGTESVNVDVSVPTRTRYSVLVIPTPEG
jgi:hypothetical protein